MSNTPPHRDESSSGYPFAPNRSARSARDSWDTPLPMDFRRGAAGDETKRDPVPRIYIEDSGQRIPIQSDSAVAPESQDDAPVVRARPQPIPATPQGETPPRMIGPYVLLRELARGGMGTVHLGEDPALRRRVAIKLLAPELTEDQDAMVRFQREARATATINHPNVALIYLVGLSDDGAPFLAMEYVGGGSLEKVVKDRVRLPYSRVADIMIQSCEALRAAYRQGIIHRDIKPANIMLGEDGVVKVVDFGLAKFFHEESYRTMAGMVMGTPRYMSPEQTQGRELDFRSDIYSLGASFYHVLTGRPPFEGESPTQIMMKHVNSPIIPMRSINPEVPLEFDDVIRKCMMKDPNDRYQDYSDLISDVARIRLQYTARERGALVSSVNELPTVRMGPDGMPLPPTGQPVSSTYDSRASSASVRTGGVQGAMPTEQDHEHTPPWRLALIVAAIVIVCLVVGIMVLWPAPEPEPAPSLPAGEEGGKLQSLLQRLVAEGRTPAANQTGGASQPDADFLRYRATEEILIELSNGVLVYRSEEGRYPNDLSDLVRAGSAVEIFDTDTGGRPLDGWGRRVEWSSSSRTIFSAGLDGRTNTSDDIEIDLDGEMTIADRTVYDDLIAVEDRRREGK